MLSRWPLARHQKQRQRPATVPSAASLSKHWQNYCSRILLCSSAAGNLVGQYPEAFVCGVLRNPVIDLGLMIHCSDIPDWTYIEAFGSKVKLGNVEKAVCQTMC